MSDPFYRAFEDRYRGSREAISARLQAYLPFLAPLPLLYQPARALDVGCGRGEWLELAGAAGFEASGVDLDDGMLAVCRERGLAVQTADALVTLRALPDASLAMVSAFHVVEHIPFDAVRELVAEALRVLQPGGLLILETPNPENLVVGASSFYRDPSHLRPLPPELLAFAVEFGGFARSKVVRLQEDPSLRAARRVMLQQVLDGASPDYAVIGQKAAPAELLANFETAFGPEYGLSLEVMARRYDEQGERRYGELQQAAADARLAHQRLGELAEASGQAAHRIGQGEARLAGLESRLDASEAYGREMAQRVVDLMQSRSWRITAPLRWATARYNRVRDALRRGSVLSSLAWRVKALVRSAGQAVLRSSAGKRIARTLLARFPKLQARLRDLMYQTPLAAGAPAGAQEPGQLSARGRRLHAQLEQAIDSKDSDAHRH